MAASRGGREIFRGVLFVIDDVNKCCVLRVACFRLREEAPGGRERPRGSIWVVGVG
jgi:hypothetical protein